MNNINSLIKNYYSWLKDKTTWKNIGQWTEITSPYLDRNNDYIQIYLKKNNTGFLLTDNGDTVSGLKEEGCNLDSSKRRQFLSTTLRGYGVTENKGELQRTAHNIDDFPLAKHSLIQAILSVNDMFYTATPHVMNLFFDDVKEWLENSKIRYSERVSFNGRSGYQRNFDFLIPKSSKKPERLIKTINKPGKSFSDSFIMDWLDTKDTRQPDTAMYAFINDTNRDQIDQLERKSKKPLIKNKGMESVDNLFDNGQKSQPNIVKTKEAFKNYDIHSVLWSEKNKAQAELVA